MIDSYPLTIISPQNLPDLDIMYVERFPRYDKNGAAMWTCGGDPNNPAPANGKKWPAAGDTVTSVVHYGNFGFAPASNVTIKFEVLNDTDGDMRLDASESLAVPYHTATFTIPSIEVGATGTHPFEWTWPADNAPMVFVRVTINPDKSIPEFCWANNQRCEYAKARAFFWNLSPESAQVFKEHFKNKIINLTGSFSDYDWNNAEADRMTQFMQDTILPTTTPNGITSIMRVDDYRNPGENDRKFFDGDYMAMTLPYDDANTMTFDTAVGHEIGHCCFALPDIYGQNVHLCNVFLKDENGKPYSGTPVFPSINGNDTAIYTTATSGYPDPLHCGNYTPLMDSCKMWLDDMCAGIVQKVWGKQQRGDMWDIYSVSIPKTNILQVLDVNDAPLVGAAVYIYHITNTDYGIGQDTVPNKYYADRPKFTGITDNSGNYMIPETTSPAWDDWTTDINDGAVAVSTPFALSDRKCSSPWMLAGDMLLIKIISSSGTEFQTLSLSEVNTAYFAGNTYTATYKIRTSLTNNKPQAIRLPEIPEAIQKTNKKPVAKLKYGDKIYTVDPENDPDLSITLPKGESVTFDASVSTDPENQPLYYRWDTGFDYFRPSNEASNVVDTSKLEAGKEYDLGFFVIDGVRFSDYFSIRIKVVEPAAQGKQK